MRSSHAGACCRLCSCRASENLTNPLVMRLRIILLLILKKGSVPKPGHVTPSSVRIAGPAHICCWCEVATVVTGIFVVSEDCRSSGYAVINPKIVSAF